MGLYVSSDYYVTLGLNQGLIIKAI